MPRISGAYDLVNGDSKFIGGVGLEYTIYPKDRSVSDLEKFRTAVRDGTIDNLKVLDEGKMYETEVIEKFGDNYVQYIRGYFLAPRTGSYTFYMTGDD